MEFILKISYLQVKRAKDSAEEKKFKEKIQKEIKKELGVLVDVPKPGNNIACLFYRLWKQQ